MALSRDNIELAAERRFVGAAPLKVVEVDNAAEDEVYDCPLVLEDVIKPEVELGDALT